ncbi:hypothetical protein JCM8097_009050 [Rhodosporidiobolus ruineniae]
MLRFSPPSSPTAPSGSGSLPPPPSSASSTAEQTIPSAEVADPASPGFAASLLDPRTGRPLAPPLRRPGMHDPDAPPHASFLHISSSPSRDRLRQHQAQQHREQQGMHRPSLPDLQPRSPHAYPSSSSAAYASATGAREAGPTLSRHASEGTFRRSGSPPISPASSGLAEGSRAFTFPPPPPRARTVPPPEEVGSLNGAGRDVLDSTPPPAAAGPSSFPPPPPAAQKPAAPPAPAPAPPVALPRVASPVPLGSTLNGGLAPTVDVASATHLPPLEKALAAGQPTALQNWDVSTELEFSVAKVVREEVLDEVLKDQDALSRFREFVEAREGTDPLLLDLYNDLKVFSDLATHLRLSSSAILSTYLTKTSPSRLVLPISIRGPVLATLSSSASLGLSLKSATHELLTRLFEGSFKPYLQGKLVEHAVARLGSWKAGLGWTGAGRAPNMVTDGLAASYCLTNPRLADNPIVLSSTGFSELTGYPLDAIVGRNCRFLQGPGTAPESTLRLREALNAGEGITSLLLNYRVDGKPFYNLLCMLPLKDAHGEVKYFLGGQIDVTGSIVSLGSLAIPALASSPPGEPNGPVPPPGQAQFSPLVQAQTDRLFAAQQQTGPMNAAGVAEFAKGLPGGGGGGEATLVQLPKGIDGADKGKSAVNGSNAAGTSSRSTLSVHQPEPFPSAAPGTAHHRRPSASSSAASLTPSCTRSRRGSFTGAAGAGVRAAVEGIANLAAAGGRRIKRMGSRESELGIGAGLEGEWEGGEDGEEGKRREREKEKERRRREGRKKVGPLLAQLRTFEATYSRVVLVRQSTREIMFCTPELVMHCGLPASVQFELTNLDFSKILVAPSLPPTPFGAEITSSPAEPAGGGMGGESPSLVELTGGGGGDDDERTRRLRRNVRSAIENSDMWTGLVGLKPEGKGKFFGKAKHGELEVKTCVLHLTPLCDKEGVCEAFVAVFG